MKLLKDLKLLTLGLLVMASACDPIEDRDTLSNSYNPDDIELEVVQSTPGGNGLTLKMNTPGVIGFWDYNINTAYTDEVQVNYPIPGTATFTYNVATAYMPDGDPSGTEYITKTIDVDIEVLDQPLPEAYYSLIGDDLGGKTWVFDTSSDLWWFMSSNDGNAWSLWWNAAECCAPPDQGGKMVFDLDGGANYTYYTDAAGAAVGSGTFSFNANFDKFYIGGGINILGADGTDGVNDCAKSLGSFAEFQIIELTDERMVLYIVDGSCTSGWTWVFVPES